MIPDPYTCEKLVLEHRHTLLGEAEHERMLLNVPEHFSPSLRRLVGKFGVYLIVLRMKLKQLEQSNQISTNTARSDQ
jgi:hypothetical protein